MRFAFLLLSSLALASAAACAEEPCPARVRISFPDEEAPPMYYQHGQNFQEPAGLAVHMILKAMAQTRCAKSVELVRRPIKRGYVELAYGEIDMLVGATYTEERAKVMEFPSYQGQLDTRMAWMHSATHLWVRRGDKSIQWDGKVLRGPPGFKVGVVLGTKTELLANERGWDVDAAPTPALTFEKLLAGRMPVVLVPMINESSLTDDVRVQLERLDPSVETYGVYSVPSKSFYTKHPEFVARFWSALCKVSRAEPRLLNYGKLPACR